MAKKKKKKIYVESLVTGEMVEYKPYGSKRQREDTKSGYRHKLKKLPKEINHLHSQAVESYQNHLEYARQCGELLIKAKDYWKKAGIESIALKRLQHLPEGKTKIVTTSRIRISPSWMKWVEENFEGSYPLAANYMRIAKEWDGDILKEYRLREPYQGSIESALKALRKPRQPSNQQKISKKELTYKGEKKAAKRYKSLHRQFMMQIDNLYDYEFDLLCEGFDEYFWPKMERELRKAVIALHGRSPYPEYDPEDDFGTCIHYQDTEEDDKELERRLEEVQREAKQKLAKARESRRRKKKDRKRTPRPSAA